MCSISNIDDVENGVDHLAAPIRSVIDPMCNKCRISIANILLRGTDKYCKSCFLKTTVHKFKAVLGKSKLIKPDSRVLVVIGLGHASTALLHFIRSGLDLAVGKRFKFVPIILYIDDLDEVDKAVMRERLMSVERQIRNMQFDVHLSTWPRIFKWLSFGDISLPCTTTSADTVILDAIENSCPSNQFSQQQALAKICQHFDCKFVLTAKTASESAAAILSAVCAGRGVNIALDTGFVDDRCDHVTFIRPLRPFDIKELAIYNAYMQINPVIVSGYGARNSHNKLRTNAPSATEQLTSDFVNGLQLNFPATVSTILRTGEKLHAPTRANDNFRQCVECLGQLEVADSRSKLNVEDAIKFSEAVSTAVLSSEQLNSLVHIEKEIIGVDKCFSCRINATNTK